MKRRISATAVAAVLALTISTPAMAQCGGMMHSGSHAGHESDKTEPTKVIVYPIDYCIVSGETLGEMGDPVKYEYKDRTVYFCCKGCIKKFQADPAKYLATLDAAIRPNAVSEAAKTEPTRLTQLNWCIVSGDSLGSMGKTVQHKYKDRELTFCCKGCIKEFESHSAAYIARLDSALAGQITQPKPESDSRDAETHSSEHQH